MPRQRKASKRFKVEEGESHFPATVEEHYHKYYFEILDLVTSSIKKIFDQPEYRMYQHFESLLLKTLNGENFDKDLKEVMQFYGDDFKTYMLHVQLQTLATYFEDENQVTLQDIVTYFKKLSAYENRFTVRYLPF